MIILRTLKEVREALGLSVKRFADEAGVSTRTVQDSEGGKPPRRVTAEKYAAVLRRYGANPSEVREIRDALGEVFTIDLDPYWRLWLHSIRAWEELTVGLVRDGHLDALRERLARIVEQHGEEGRKAREEAQEEYRRVVDEERRLEK